MSRSPQQPDPRSIEARHQPETVHATGVALFAAGLLLTLVAILFGIWGLTRWYDQSEPSAVGPPPGLMEARPSPPRPRTHGERMGDVRRRLYGQQREALKKLGWIDREADVARIPVERAMELIAERGLTYYERASASVSESGGAGGAGEEQQGYRPSWGYGGNESPGGDG